MDEEEYFGVIDEAEIERRLAKLNVPFAAEYFPDSKNYPYVVYLTPSATYYGADGVNLKRDQRFRVELYTATKKDKLRKKLFELFNDVPFEVEEISGGQKNYYVTVIEFEQTLDLEYD